MRPRTNLLRNPTALWELLKATFKEWTDDQAPRLGAALAYYAVFSLAPLLVIALAIAGLAFGREAATGQVVRQLQGLIGPETAQAIQKMIENVSQPETSILATFVGVVILLFGASGVFGELHQSLNDIWDIEPKPNRGFLEMVKDRFFSFTMMLGTGFLLLVSLIISAALSALGDFFVGLLPSWEVMVQIINFVVSLAVISVLFALVFKYVPDAQIAWDDVWIGGIITALLFTIGKVLIGLYIGHSSFSSTYGAAASLVVILLWVYYSAQILFFGAEFTQVYANTYGSRIRSESSGRLTQPSVGPAHPSGTVSIRPREHPSGAPTRALVTAPVREPEPYQPPMPRYNRAIMEQYVRQLETERTLAGALGVVLGTLISGAWMLRRLSRTGKP